MGHKGVSKRKPKAAKSFSKDKPMEAQPGQDHSVQGLVKNQSATPGNGNTNSYVWTNKKNKKGK